MAYPYYNESTLGAGEHGPQVVVMLLTVHLPTWEDEELVFKLAEGTLVNKGFHNATSWKAEIPTYLQAYASALAAQVEKDVLVHYCS